MSGTTGQSRRVEAIQIEIDPTLNKKITYQAHVQNIGWMQWVNNNEVAGTTGQSRRLEAFIINIC